MYASSPHGRQGNVGFSPSNPIQLAPIYATPNGMRSGPGGYGAGMPSSPVVGARPGSSPSGPPPQSPMLSSPPHSGGGVQMMGMSGAGGQAAGGASGSGGVSGLPAAMMQKIANQFGVVPRYENGKFVMKHTPGSENRAKFTPHQKQEKEDKKKARAAYSTPRSTSQVQGPYAHILSSGDFEVVLRYDFSYSTRTWTQTCMVVNIQKRHFAEGSLRGAYRAIDLNKPAGTGEFVAKQYKSREDQASYFADVEMQGICEFYAEKYNAKGAPKPVTFLHAFLIERVQKQGRPLFACEDFLKGKFDKFNNNYGFKSQGDEATPQTFSHFTFEYSDRTLMVVDIQGIAEGDSYTYTDPQIHTSDGKGYGKGNMGRDGMMKFFGTHLCNNICVGLGLSRTQKGGFQSTAMNPHKIEEARKRRQALLEDKEKENAPREPPLPAQQYVASQGSPGLAPQPAPVQHQEKYLQPPIPQPQEKYYQPAQQQEKGPAQKAEN